MNYLLLKIANLNQRGEFIRIKEDIGESTEKGSEQCLHLQKNDHRLLQIWLIATSISLVSPKELLLLHGSR